MKYIVIYGDFYSYTEKFDDYDAAVAKYKEEYARAKNEYMLPTLALVCDVVMDDQPSGNSE